MNNLIFDISDIFGADVGHTRAFHLEVEQEFHKGEMPVSNDLEADVTFMKTEDAIMAMVENLTGTFELKCSRCLKDIKHKFGVPLFEREFLFAVPRDQKNDPDILLVNTRRMEIDLYESFREEILLHYDAFPVCSTSCRGLCPICGIDKNKAECSHEEVIRVETSVPAEESVKPLKNLKNLTP